LLLLCCSGLWAQTFSLDQFHVSGGYSVPYAPEQFYDYWKDGFGVQAAAVYTTGNAVQGMISAEVNRFAFDENRFFRKLGLTEDVPSVEGGAVTLASLSALLRYHIPGYEVVRPFISGGLGLQYAHTGEVAITYPFAPVTDAAQGSIGVILPVGASVEFSYKGKFDMIVGLHHTINIAKQSDSNSDFSQLRIGIILPYTRGEELP
jgi:hypothetical protein